MLIATRGIVLRPPDQTRLELPKCEFEFEDDIHGHGFTESAAWDEPPLPCSLDRLLIQTEVLIEGLGNLHVTDGAVREDDAFEQNRALHLCAHRGGRVVRLHFPQELWTRHTIARTVHSATCPTA